MNPHTKPPPAAARPQTDAFNPHAHVTVAEAQRQIRAEWFEGTTCPCCDGHVQLYRRQITSSIAALLVALRAVDRDFRRCRPVPDYVTADGYVHLGKLIVDRGFPSAFRGSGDFGTLRYWDLVERSLDRRPDGCKSNGLWRLTDLGRQFADGLVRVPRYRFVYNDEVRDPALNGVPVDRYLDAKGNRVTVSVREALRERFEYDALMNALRPVHSNRHAA